MRSKEKGKIAKLSMIAKSLYILLINFLAFGIASADPMASPILVHKDQLYKVRSETIRVVTAYNVGDPRQTDDTPCISANGENICRALAEGEMRCAANFVPLGSHLYVDKIGVCLVTDRMNRRYRNRVDIAMQKEEYHKALRFGKQKLHVKILDYRLTSNCKANDCSYESMYYLDFAGTN
jgi:3D (Asp-Asp-Asp) domain-containing protein